MKRKFEGLVCLQTSTMERETFTALSVLFLLLSLPTRHGHALSPCSDKEGQALATLEAHTTDDAHGDICRFENGDFFCAKPCSKVQEAPWCVGGANMLDMAPCRVGDSSGKNSGSVEDRPAIMIKGLQTATSEGFLRELLAPIGPVKHLTIHRGENSSAAEVIFKEQAHAEEAVKRLDGVKLLDGNPIAVQKIRQATWAPARIKKKGLWASLKSLIGLL